MFKRPPRYPGPLGERFMIDAIAAILFVVGYVFALYGGI